MLPKQAEVPLTAPLSTTSSNLWRRILKARAFYVMMIPGLVWYIVFKYLPMYGLIISFKDFDIVGGIMKSPWADPWYKHFQYFFDSPYFTQLLGNTFLLSIYKMAFGLVPPVIMAILLFECRFPWFTRFVQTLSYMPHFLSWVIIYGISLALFSETTGLVNRLIVDYGGHAIPFLTSTEWFRSVLVGTDLWQNIGWGAIIYLAAIAGIDPTLYEAAKVDGAGRLRNIWHITLPGIRQVFILLLIMKLGYIFDAGFEQVYIMYNVQVYEVADIIDTWVFRTGLEQMNYSVAAAVGLFKSVIGFSLVVIANQIAKKGGGSIW